MFEDDEDDQGDRRQKPRRAAQDGDHDGPERRSEDRRKGDRRAEPRDVIE